MDEREAREDSGMIPNIMCVCVCVARYQNCIYFHKEKKESFMSSIKLFGCSECVCEV